MTKTTRNMVASLAISVAMVRSERVAAANGADGTVDARRVRTSSLALGALIDEAQERSATFRKLVETITRAMGSTTWSKATAGVAFAPAA